VPIASTRKSGSQRRVPRRRARGKSHSWKFRLIATASILLFAWILWAIGARNFAPAANTAQNRFDAIIVLGYHADKDGNPSPTQLARVTEAVHEYERGVAPRLIVTGAAVYNQFVEAQVMARTAEAQGVPASAVIIEPNARDTMQNACYAVRIMNAHHWGSAEVISSASHLPRAALIFSGFPISWRAHAAPALRPESGVYHSAVSLIETLKTMRYLVWARWRERCEP
jgi:uncharacterized SAM-binding protein YcdF (DUF218 family)